MEIYGAAVTDKLDNNRNMFSRRYFRQDCRYEFNSYTKDLCVVNNDLSRVFILDNSPVAYRLFPLNAIPSKSNIFFNPIDLILFVLVKSWFSDPTDTCLLSLLPFLDALRFCRDVRSVLSMNLHLYQNLMTTNTNSVTTQVIPSSA
jgi:CTD nuclear envelope phosphatase 1